MPYPGIPGIILLEMEAMLKFLPASERGRVIDEVRSLLNVLLGAPELA